MATIAEAHRSTRTATATAVPLESAGPARDAYRLLHLGFTIAPIVAGADKFFGLLVDWDKYLAPWMAGLSPIGGHNLMLVVGLVEIVAGLVVWFRPRFGGYLVAAWLGGIILNLLTLPGYFDVALRDFGLALGALALARLATAFGRG
jgi:hypothetical protein